MERPDAMVNEVEALRYGSCKAYGEAKSEGADTRMKAVDLARLAVFGKDSIDVHYLNRVVLFQIIGEHSKKLTELITLLIYSFQERR